MRIIETTGPGSRSVVVAARSIALVQESSLVLPSSSSVLLEVKWLRAAFTWLSPN